MDGTTEPKTVFLGRMQRLFNKSHAASETCIAIIVSSKTARDISVFSVSYTSHYYKKCHVPTPFSDSTLGQCALRPTSETIKISEIL